MLRIKKKDGVPIGMVSTLPIGLELYPKGVLFREKIIEGKCWFAKCNKPVRVYNTDADTV